MADSISLALGGRVRLLRKGLGETQDSFGARAGFDRNFVGRVERGDQNITLATLARLAHALGVTVADLVSDIRVDDVSLQEMTRRGADDGDEAPK